VVSLLDLWCFFVFDFFVVDVPVPVSPEPPVPLICGSLGVTAAGAVVSFSVPTPVAGLSLSIPVRGCGAELPPVLGPEVGGGGVVDWASATPEERRATRESLRMRPFMG